MYLTDEELKLFNEGITLSANKLIPSMVYLDDDEDSQFSAYLYATTDSANRECGYLHFRVYDGTTEDFDPALSYEGKKISEITLRFEQEVDSEDEDLTRFLFYTSDGIEIIYFNGEYKTISTPSQLDSLSLLLASKIFFIDIIRRLIS